MDLVYRRKVCCVDAMPAVGSRGVGLDDTGGSLRVGGGDCCFLIRRGTTRVSIGNLDTDTEGSAGMLIGPANESKSIVEAVSVSRKSRNDC